MLKVKTNRVGLTGCDFADSQGGRHSHLLAAKGQGEDECWRLLSQVGVPQLDVEVPDDVGADAKVNVAWRTPNHLSSLLCGL